MTAAEAHYDVRALGELLDRAVHQTVRRFAIVAPPFVLADALGSILQLAPLSGWAGWIALMFLGMVCENRARVVVIASADRNARRGIAWSAAFGHVRALVFAVVGMLDIVAPYGVVGVVAGAAFLIVRAPLMLSTSRGFAVVFLAGAAIALMLSALLVGVLLLVVLAAVAATIDTVLDGTAPHRSLGRWLRHTFRRRSLLTTLLAAGVLVLLVAGVPELLSAVFPWGPVTVRSSLFAIPEGVADAIALLFVWEWRDMILVRRDGDDLSALLDTREAAQLTQR